MLGEINFRGLGLRATCLTPGRDGHSVYAGTSGGSILNYSIRLAPAKKPR